MQLAGAVFEALGGYEARFQSGGGGLINHDFRNRALAHAGIQPISLLGEGVFHQFHGGVATNVTPEQHPMSLFKAEYQQIRGKAYAPGPSPEVRYFGTMPDLARRFIAVP